MPYSNQIYMKNWRNINIPTPIKITIFFRLRLQKQRRTKYQRKLSVLINTNIEKKNG